MTDPQPSSPVIAPPKPLPTNKFLDFLNLLISKILEVGADAAEAWAKTMVPWLNIPILSTLFGWGVGWLETIVSVAVQKNTDNMVLDIMKNWNNAAVVKAAQKLAQDGGTNVQDVQALADAEGNALSWPGTPTIVK